MELYNYFRSSASYRVRIALALKGLDYEYKPVHLARNEQFTESYAAVSAARLVPILRDGEHNLTQSLAIIEYLAEKFPQARLWPEDRARRAHARSISAEMHSGFMALRNECGMNLHRPVRAVELSADARANVARIEEIWIECRERRATSGPFLFGAFGAADAMFAPVVHRFRTYAIPVAPQAAAYMETMMALPAFAEWTRAGLAETLVIEKFETV